MQSLNERFHARRRQIRPSATTHPSEGRAPTSVLQHRVTLREEAGEDCKLRYVRVLCLAPCCLFTESGMRFLDQMDCEPQGWAWACLSGEYKSEDSANTEVI